MSMNHVIGQHFFIGLSGHSLTANEKDFIVENNIGGVCLFGRNVAEPRQVYDLCAELQSLRHKMADKAPLFVGIDMEGGRVHRLKPPFTQWPAAKKLGDLDAPTVSFNLANRMAQELRAVGINLDFAPCVDVLTNPANTVIGDRALSTDPELVSKHVSALVRGFIKAGVLTCAKHFPGHGNTLADSHLVLPVEESNMARLESLELIPFKKAFKSRVDMVMTSHILFPNIDPEWPVTLSEIFIKKLIRNEYRFKGLIVTDDLGMKAMSDNYGVDEVPVRALQAGVDMLLYCNEPEAPPIALEAVLGAVAQGTVSKVSLDESHRRILEIKKSKLQDVEPFDFKQVEGLIGRPEHLAFASAVASGQIPEGLLPE